MTRGVRVLALSLAVLSACVRQRKMSGFPQRYTCDTAALTRQGDSLVVGEKPARFVGREDDGDHYVLESDNQMVEYVLNADPFRDAKIRIYGVGDSVKDSTAKVRGRGVCPASGGYSDTLVRFVRGASPEEVAAELKLDEKDARERIRYALWLFRCRFHEECE
jgi:hypothetical protein